MAICEQMAYSKFIWRGSPHAAEGGSPGGPPEGRRRRAPFPRDGAWKNTQHIRNQTPSQAASNKQSIFTTSQAASNKQSRFTTSACECPPGEGAASGGPPGALREGRLRRPAAV